MKETVVTDAAAAYGPAPRTRSAGAPARPAEPRKRLRVVPDPTLQSETAADPDATAEHITAGHSFTDGANAGAGRFQVAGWQALYGRSRDYWTPPALFTEQPASLAELTDYARYAPWTQQSTGIGRTAGLTYTYGLAYPYTVISRYREWVIQRPLRLAAHLAGIKVLSLTGPGIWVVDHLIYPAARLAGHVFL